MDVELHGKCIKTEKGPFDTEQIREILHLKCTKLNIYEVVFEFCNVERRRFKFWMTPVIPVNKCPEKKILRRATN